MDIPALPSHPNPEFHTVYEAAAHKLLRNGTSEELATAIEVLNRLNPTLNLPSNPTLQVLANALKVNEARRVGPDRESNPNNPQTTHYETT